MRPTSEKASCVIYACQEKRGVFFIFWRLRIIHTAVFNTVVLIFHRLLLLLFLSSPFFGRLQTDTDTHTYTEIMLVYIVTKKTYIAALIGTAVIGYRVAIVLVLG